MTQETDETDDPESTADRPEDEAADEPDGRSQGGIERSHTPAPGADRSFVEYIQWAILAILVLVVAIATLRFYFAASSAVDRFVTRQYRPLFQAAFNVVILLAAGVGLSLLVRRLS